MNGSTISVTGPAGLQMKIKEFTVQYVCLVVLLEQYNTCSATMSLSQFLQAILITGIVKTQQIKFVALL